MGLGPTTITSTDASGRETGLAGAKWKREDNASLMQARILGGHVGQGPTSNANKYMSGREIGLARAGTGPSHHREQGHERPRDRARRHEMEAGGQCLFPSQARSLED